MLIGAYEIKLMFYPFDALANHPITKGSAANKIRQTQKTDKKKDDTKKDDAEDLDEDEGVEKVTIEETISQMEEKKDKEAKIRRRKSGKNKTKAPAAPKRVDPVC